jgi:thioesterase domain-containing protein
LPVFFNEADSRLSQQGVWSVPCPLYAVSHWAHGLGFVRARKLTELAGVQLAGIRRLQPAGPYRIAGYSFGGLVAIEIAQQLQRDGQEVELLFLLDPMVPEGTEGESQRHMVGRGPAGVHEPAGSRLRRHVDAVARRPWRAAPYVATQVWASLAARARHSVVAHWLVYQLVHLYGRRPNRISTMLLPKDRWPAFSFSAKRLSRGYVVKPYRGRVSAVFSDSELCEPWRRLLGADAELHVAESSHAEMFSEPARSAWMRVLAECIEELDARARTPGSWRVRD